MRAGALAIMAVGIVLLAGLGFVYAGRSGEASAKGVVTNVVSRDIGHASAITLRTADGRELQFTVADDELKTPGHLREHMAYGTPLTVYYRRTGDTLVTTRMED